MTPARLPPQEVEALLSTATVARIGCGDAARVYVVPVSYAYHAGAVIGHTGEGFKLRMMRANPEVCVEVDEVLDPGTWRSVIAWGRFEELSGAAAAEAIAVLAGRFRHASPVPETTAADPHVGPAAAPVTPPAVVFRIVLGEKTGRYENSGPWGGG